MSVGSGVHRRDQWYDGRDVSDKRNARNALRDKCRESHGAARLCDITEGWDWSHKRRCDCFIDMSEEDQAKSTADDLTGHAPGNLERGPIPNSNEYGPQ